jgi:hypothetical protein
MSLRAATAVRGIIPQKPLFLVGFPHAPRTSEGVHDPLLASALCLRDDTTALLFIAVDILFVSANTVRFCRTALNQATGIPESNVLISATHTHSGPVTSTVLAWRDDPVVPPPDPEYLQQFHRAIIESGKSAFDAVEPARLAVTAATASGVGCNRLDPEGPFDPQVGLVAVQRQRDRRLTGLLLVYGMHPTVLHEDSRLVSADFPHFTRQRLNHVYPQLVTLYHLGPCGNLSPRYHVKAQTFAEAEKLGNRLGDLALNALAALREADFSDQPHLAVNQAFTELPAHTFLSVAEAQARLHMASERFEQLKRAGASHGPLRTAECVVFGCEEALTLATAQASGDLAKWQQRYRHAEVQVFRLGDLFIAAWPGEQFVEYGLELKQRAGVRAFVISLANGELQGYIVTPQAAAAGGYEAAFALFKPQAGECLLQAALNLIKELA